MSDKQVLEHIKEAFPTKIEAQILEKEDIDVAIGKARILVLFLKSELRQVTNSFMLVCMKERGKNRK